MILMMILCGVLFTLGIASLIALWFEETAKRVADYEAEQISRAFARRHNHRYHRCHDRKVNR